MVANVCSIVGNLEAKHTDAKTDAFTEIGEYTLKIN